jgi:NAD(P)-dependent dehydrogenase (short-subunit alcohol dehydrogenase family)
MRLQGKTALIAGASRNLGKAIALAFARDGAEKKLRTQRCSSRPTNRRTSPATG